MKCYVLAPENKFELAVNKGQGQPNFIILTFLVVLMYLILHTKFQGHRPLCSGEEKN